MSFGGIQRLASKSFTSPEIRVAKADASKWVIGPIPERPATTPSQLEARSLPSGDGMPMPVMATRRLDMFGVLLSIPRGVPPRAGHIGRRGHARRDGQAWRSAGITP